jgi:hypothetical protein
MHAGRKPGFRAAWRLQSNAPRRQIFDLHSRRRCIPRLPPGDKYLTYIKSTETFHTLFALNTSECGDNNVSQKVCAAVASWLRSSALAFLDFYLERRVAAQFWLQNPFLKMASESVADIERK